MASNIANSLNYRSCVRVGVIGDFSNKGTKPADNPAIIKWNWSPLDLF